jgi:hypothetical protein
MTTSLKFAGQTIAAANILGISKFDCAKWFASPAEIAYDGMFSFVGNNLGLIPGFIDDLNTLAGWTTKKLALYILAGGSSFMEYNNVDTNLIDVGGPWQVTSSV